MEYEDDSDILSIDKHIYDEFYSTDTSFSKSLDLDLFFGYGKKIKKSTEPLEEQDFKQNRVFISKIDTFNGKYITQVLQALKPTDYDLCTSFANEMMHRDNEDFVYGVVFSDESIFYVNGKFLSKRLFRDEVKTEEEEEEADEEEAEVGGVGEEDKPEKGARQEDEEEGDIKNEVDVEEMNKEASEDVKNYFENFTEYEYIDALYAKYDVSKLTVVDYGELLNLKTHEERLMYLEKKFGVLKKDYLVDKTTSTENIPEKSVTKQKGGPINYELVGTLKWDHPKEKMDEFFSYMNEILKREKDNNLNFLLRVFKCGVICFDITTDPSEIAEARFVLDALTHKLARMEEMSPKKFPEMDITVTFLILSPLMTWAATKPIDPEEPDLPFNEKDFKKRRPHPNYKDHFQLEKDLFAAGLKFKNKLRVAVIGVGGVYGYEQNALHYLFKLGWLNEELPIFGKGTNLVPLINIDDLSMLLHMVIQNFPKSKYIFAVEKPVFTLKDITKAVSKAVGTGSVKKVPKEDAFLIPELSQPFYDLLTSNLNVESNVLDDIQMQWKNEVGFVEIIKSIGNEFKTCRNLKDQDPAERHLEVWEKILQFSEHRFVVIDADVIAKSLMWHSDYTNESEVTTHFINQCYFIQVKKILVVGPPGSGKTRVSLKLSQYYKLNYLTLPKAIENYVQDIKSKIMKVEDRIAEKSRIEAKKNEIKEDAEQENEEQVEEEEKEEEEEDDEEEIDNEEVLNGLKEKLKTIQQQLAEGGGTLNDKFSVKVMKNQLLSHACQSQGYVLDGFPTTLKQTKALFGIGTDEEEDDEPEEDVDEDESRVEGEGEGEENENQGPKINKKIIPDLVICLEASNDHLYKNLLRHQEVIRRYLTEEDIFKSIIKYRLFSTSLNKYKKTDNKNIMKQNTDENTPLIFFDNIELYPHIFNVEEDKTPHLDQIIEKILHIAGSPQNYETIIQQESEKLKKEQLERTHHESKTKRFKETKKLRRSVIKKKLQLWADQVDRMKEEEEEILAKESLPLRHYLIKFVFPTLTNGLIEIASVKPDDPIDYLAEYLFKENPKGRMFVENREEPSEVKKMLNMLFDFKEYLQRVSYYSDISEVLNESSQI
ncbi:adenylate kinase 7-like [Lycorma delicatula]|uniref:adenylate kinase 7-like n=1 Tax=Lycorma delicatula TaxID=130591 RepID=UPI003F512EC4